MSASREPSLLPHLGFREAPPLRVYLHHAYTTGLLTTHAAWRAVLLNHYIQVQIAPDEFGHEGESFDFFPFVDYRMLGKLGFFELRHWAPQEVAGRPEPELMEAIRARLDGERSIEVYLDEYFIPTSWAFRQRHFRHQHLLIGFTDGCFVGVGYGADGRFGYSKIPPPLLYRAILSRDRSKDTYASRPSVIEIERKTDRAEAIDAVRIRRQLEDFLESRNRYSEYSDYPFARDIAGARFGVKAYGEIFGRFREALSENRKCDTRFSRLALERAELMTRRIGAVVNATERIRRAVLREWRQLAEAWREFHLSMFEQNLRLAQGRTGLDEQIALRFEENTHREVELSEQALAYLT